MRTANRIVHIITGMVAGGAETALERLIIASRPHGWEHLVISLGRPGPMGERWRSAGAEVHALSMTGLVTVPTKMTALVSRLRRVRASLIMGWMYHGCCAASMASFFLPKRVPIMWAIRSGLSGSALWPTRAVRYILGVIAGHPDSIVFVSRRSRSQHAALGFSRRPCQHIPNGYDLSRYVPKEHSRMRMRSAIGIPPEALVVAWVGRWHPDKAPELALRACAIAQRGISGLHLLMVGNGCEDHGPARDMAKKLDLQQCHLLGRREDIPDLLAAADVLLLSSRSEAFPNVIAEAMACGVPCVSTDVGDTVDLIGDTGMIAEDISADSLAARLVTMFALSPERRRELGIRARERIFTRFAMEAVLHRYERLWRGLISNAGDAA